MRAPTYQNFAQKFRWYDFCDVGFFNLLNFQITLHVSIFVAQKRIVYEKASIFYGKYDEIKIK